jgi:hypothetical protein
MTIANEHGARRSASEAESELQHLEHAVRVAHAQGFVVVPMGIDYWADRLERFMLQFNLVSHQLERIKALRELLGQSARQ